MKWLRASAHLVRLGYPKSGVASPTHDKFADGLEEIADALEAQQAVVEAAQRVDVIVAAHHLEEAAKREPGPWAKPHIEALEALGKALDDYGALDAPPEGEKP